MLKSYHVNSAMKWTPVGANLIFNGAFLLSPHQICIVSCPRILYTTELNSRLLGGLFCAVRSKI